MYDMMKSLHEKWQWSGAWQSISAIQFETERSDQEEERECVRERRERSDLKVSRGKVRAGPARTQCHILCKGNL